MNLIFDAREKYESLSFKCRTLIIVGSAVLFSLGFSYKGAWLLNWLCLVPLALEIFTANKTSKRVLRSLFCFFFVFYVCVYSWLISLYPLDFAGLDNTQSVLVIITGLTVIPLLHSAMMSLSMWLMNKLSSSFGEGFFKCACLALGNVLGEFAQGVGPLGFPWARMYVSQMGALQNLQSASVFGSYFVTFAVVLVNFLLASALLNKGKARLYSLAAIGLFSANLVFGCITMAAVEDTYSKDNELCAIALQGNVGSYEKWGTVESSYDRYLSLAKEAAEYCKKNGLQPDIAVIPETAFPVTALYVEDGKATRNRACSVSTQIAEGLCCPVITGTFVSEDTKEYNSLLCFDTMGEIKGMYHKKKLVPFGEFVPYRSLISACFPFLSQINMLSSDLTVGDISQPIQLENHRIAGLICFDSVFPEALRTQVKNGADVIAVSTNDSWYKTSKALDQHSCHSIMRAIENRRPIIRSANTGISMLIEPTGRIAAYSEVNQTEFITGVLHTQKHITVFTRMGDITLYCSFFVLILLLALKAYKAVEKRFEN